MLALKDLCDGPITIDSPRGESIQFTSDRFSSDSYLWVRGEAVYVSFMESKARGNFRTLVEAILAAGMTVKVPTPLGRMEQIVQKCGYEFAVEDDHDIGPVEVWTMKGNGCPP